MTSKLWLITSSSEAGPLRSASREPLAEVLDEACGLLTTGSSQALAAGASSKSNSPSSASLPLRLNGKREPRDSINRSKRFFNAGGRSMTGSWYCFWLVALRLTAMIRSQWLATTGTIGRGLSRPPSTSMRLPCTTGVKRLGIAAEARMAWCRQPS